MNRFSRGASLAVLISLTGGASQAAITADQLWAAWQDAGAQAGLAVTAESVTREGTSLRLSGVTISAGTVGDPATTVEAVIDEILLTEGADGTVTILPAPQLSIAAGDEVNGGTLTLNHQGGAITVTENLGEMTYDVVADQLGANVAITAVSALPKDDGTEAMVDYTMDLTLAAPVITVTDTPEANRTWTFEILSPSLSYDVVSRDEGMGTNSAQTGTTASVAISGSFAAPKTIALADLVTPEAWGAAFSEGMALTLTTEQGISESTAREENAFLPMDLTATALPGTASFSLSKDGYDLRASGEGLQGTFKTESLPIPQVQVDMGPLEVALTIPFMAPTTPGRFGVTLKFADIVVNDEAWGLIDPGATLPRDPAQISLVTDGTMLIDFLALLAAESAGMTEVVPPQPQTLEISELLVSAAGALLTGTGSFTFDNATGQPVPAGEANFTLTGGNALIDGLVGIGLLSADDAGGARMMMAMFMNAAGEDVLTSKIEASADGSIRVNGQQVQ